MPFYEDIDFYGACDQHVHRENRCCKCHCPLPLHNTSICPNCGDDVTLPETYYDDIMEDIIQENEREAEIASMLDTK